ncbi:MAG: folate-binding protein YgfZ [Geminicoccaceae bacterium]
MPDYRCLPLDDRGLIRIGGPDARPFLQGLISNDMDILRPDSALYAALLTPQGKFLFDFLLHDRGDHLLLDGERGRLGDLLRRLTLYRLRSKVTLEDVTGELAVLAVFDRKAIDASALPSSGAVPDPRLPELGLRVVLPRAEVDAFVERHGLERADRGQYERLRLGLGVPDGSRDLLVDRSLLLESGFEELHGVSFDKGCFVGQELTARTKHRGLIKRRLLPVRVDGPLPPPGTQVTRAGKDAGEVRSGEGELALALLRLEQLAADGEPLMAGDAVLTPAPPPWLPMAALERRR